VAAQFSGLRTDALRLELEARQRETDLVVVELLDLGQARIVVLEAVLTVIVRLLQTLGGQPCSDVHYYLPWPRPSWAAQYQACLGGVCHFDAPRMILRLPTALLDSPCLTADADAFAAAYQECESKLGREHQATPVSDRVRSRLLRCEGTFPTLAMLAGEQAMSARSLMRKLKAEDSSYQTILDQVRFDMARWHLLHTDAPMEAIAERLGLQDTSNFSRSFRRWSGVAPSQFRVDGRPDPSRQAPGAGHADDAATG
jgi:AraC-like DNA-binding protein